MTDAHQTIADAAASVLDSHQLSRVLVAPTSDSEGDDAWQVTIVLKTPEVTGDQALDTISRIRRALVATGDDQFPIVDFATEQELAADVDSEP